MILHSSALKGTKATVQMRGASNAAACAATVLASSLGGCKWAYLVEMVSYWKHRQRHVEWSAE